MGSRPTKSLASKHIIPMFLDSYEDKHGVRYLVNWPAIKAAEKVGNYYTKTEAAVAMEYYFRTKSNHDIWDFLENIDRLLRLARSEEESKKRLEKLMKDTKVRMKRFEH